MANDKQYRLFTGVLYPDSQSYDFLSVVDLIKHRFKEWAMCVHDQDVDDDGNLKKLHLHWVGRCDPRKVSSCAKILGLKENEIEIGRDFKLLVQYLIHFNDSDKFQYSVESVESNIPDIAKYFRNLSEGQLVKDLASAKMRMSWYDLIQYAVENDSYDILRRNLGIIKLVWEESPEYSYRNFRERDMM